MASYQTVQPILVMNLAKHRDYSSPGGTEALASARDVFPSTHSTIAREAITPDSLLKDSSEPHWLFGHTNFHSHLSIHYLTRYSSRYLTHLSQSLSESSHSLNSFSLTCRGMCKLQYTYGQVIGNRTPYLNMPVPYTYCVLLTPPQAQPSSR